MSKQNQKTYNLRENPKQTEKGRSNSKTREEDRDSNTSNIDETEGATDTMLTTDTTPIDTENVGTTQENPTQDDDTGLDRGEYEGNPNTTIKPTTTKPKGTDMGENETILQILQQIQQQNQETQKQNQETQQKIEHQNQEIRQEIQRTKEQNNTIIETLTTQKSEIMEMRTDLNTIREELRKEIAQQIELNNEKLIKRLEDKSKEWETRQEESNKTTLETCMKETIDICQTLTNEIGNELNRYKTDNQNFQHDTKKLKEITEIKFTNLNADMREIKEGISKTTKEVYEISKTTDTLKEKIENLEREPQNIIGNGTREIYITCPGAETSDSNIKFNGRERNPIEFINRFKRHMENIGNRRGREHTKFEDILENCLEDSAARWWQVIKDDIQTIEEFEQALVEKYWSSDIQRGIKRRMELERYRPGGRLTRAEYFIDRVLTLKNMTPSMSEEEIVEFISEQFDARVKDARRVQNVTTIRGFEKLLSREDVDEKNGQLRHRNTEDNRRNEWRGGNSRDDKKQNENFPRSRNFDRDNQNRSIDRYRNENRNQINYQLGGNRSQHETYKNYHNGPNQGRQYYHPSQEQQKMCQAINITPNRNHQEGNPPRGDSVRPSSSSGNA